jgi:hypothetical protein
LSPYKLFKLPQNCQGKDVRVAACTGQETVWQINLLTMQFDRAGTLATHNQVNLFRGDYRKINAQYPCFLKKASCFIGMAIQPCRWTTPLEDPELHLSVQSIENAGSESQPKVDKVTTRGGTQLNLQLNSSATTAGRRQREEAQTTAPCVP